MVPAHLIDHELARIKRMRKQTREAFKRDMAKFDTDERALIKLKLAAKVEPVRSGKEVV